MASWQKEIKRSALVFHSDNKFRTEKHNTAPWYQLIIGWSPFPFMVNEEPCKHRLNCRFNPIKTVLRFMGEDAPRSRSAWLRTRRWKRSTPMPMVLESATTAAFKQLVQQCGTSIVEAGPGLDRANRDIDLQQQTFSELLHVIVLHFRRPALNQAFPDTYGLLTMLLPTRLFPPCILSRAPG